ncbi:MAG: (Fe-S)-binding protein [Candidatus Bathyarchaeota archaeon]|nr:(Fe-S)-binding protein [Candidatus Bathyarchaeota archaeon]MDH5622917.1 (Fe-S)-binding protein [Candidatus Bathyarchaeota archaeon]MDH5635348.1 (Fe-S)-binding protein [Candidatus Bathyarchaeota archaeon]
MMQAYAKQIHRCFRCGYCKFPSDFTDFNCPSYSRFRLETYSTGGRLWLIWAWLKKEIEWSEHFAEIVFSCATCRNCVEQCPMGFSDDIVDWIVSARSDMVEKGLALPHIRDFLNNISKHGNPWGTARSKRDAWAEGIRRYKPGDEYFLYVGCVGSYEERGQRMARSFAELLDEAEVSFGILGAEEDCDGNEAYMLGEMGLFQELAKKNVQKFKELEVKKVVTLSPHAYNSMKNKYPRFGDFEVFHYTQLLSEMIQQGKIELSELKAKVTYHDPCFLGRYNGIYDIPREILKSIPGIKLTEMERTKENSFCCGGGSGNFVTDLLGGSEENPSRIRVREAHETGAEILVVACPSCMMMLDDAVKDEGLEGELSVKGIAELVKESSK